MKLTELIRDNKAVESLLSRKENLASLTCVEESLLVAAAFDKKPQNEKTICG